MLKLGVLALLRNDLNMVMMSLMLPLTADGEDDPAPSLCVAHLLGWLVGARSGERLVSRCQ